MISDIKKNKKYLSVLFLVSLTLSFSACEWSDSDESSTTTTIKKPSVNVPKFDASSAYDFIKKQVDFGARTPSTPEHKACAEWLEQTLGSFADEVMVQEAEVTVYTGKKVPMYNIIGSFNPENKERILLAAHWDTRPFADQDDERTDEPILGANDGGSGVGVLLEIASILKAQKVDIGVDIIFFDVEDYGNPETDNSYCLGSQYWGKNLHKPNYTAKYGILLDMVGAADAIFLKEQISMLYAADVVEKVWKTASELGYGSYFSHETTRTPITDDHRYVNELAKIPMIDIIHYTSEGGFGDFWHTHDDDMKIIDKGALKAVGHTVLTVIYREDAKI